MKTTITKIKMTKKFKEYVVEMITSKMKTTLNWSQPTKVKQNKINSGHQKRLGWPQEKSSLMLRGGGIIKKRKISDNVPNRLD